MKISSKGKYALRLLVDIATATNLPVSLSDISARQGISLKYLEQVASILKDAKIISSERGAAGGYKLAKPASEIKVAEILGATDDMPEFATCVNAHCPKSKECKTQGIWQTLSCMITSYLSRISLDDLINQTNDFVRKYDKT